MSVRMCLFVCCLTLLACSEDEKDGESETPAPPDAGCDEITGRAILAGPFECDNDEAFITVEGVDVFTYEASHPTASATRAYPCADQKYGNAASFLPPAETAEACSLPGVRPWHNVKWGEAKQACESIGWRLCTGLELKRACEGQGGLAFSYGSQFEAGRCNSLASWTAEGSTTASEAPTGEHDGCVSTDGLYDGVGNLWEWASDTTDGRRFYQGQGWKVIAQRHHPEGQVCAEQSSLPEATALDFYGDFVGFRCCR